MKERPILMGATMVRALLAGRKTQTRRVVKTVGADGGVVFQDYGNGRGWWPYRSDDGETPTVSVKRGGKFFDDEIPVMCPYGVPGDRLWVRETWGLFDGEGIAYDYRQGNPDTCPEGFHVVYPADDESGTIRAVFRWRPAIFMRPWMSRIKLEVTAVRVERLDDMEGQAPYRGESDALAEGINAIHHGDGAYYYSAFRNEPHPENWAHPTAAYRELWDTINGDKPDASWSANPWVWVVEFKCV